MKKRAEVAGVPRYLSRLEVLEILGIGENTLKRGVRSGAIPAPVKIGAGRIGWRTDRFREWQDSLESESTGA